jgi:hypothetical protein
MIGWKTVLAIGIAALLGAAGGYALTRVRPIDTIDGAGLGWQQVEERLDSVDRRLASIERTAATRPLDTSRPSVSSDPEGSPIRSSPPSTSAELDPRDSLRGELREIGGRLDDLLEASLCRSPEALAEAEDRAKLERPGNAQALEEAWEIVRYARNRGRWTELDGADLREALPRLTRSQQNELLEVLLPALQQEMEVDAFPPF